MKQKSAITALIVLSFLFSFRTVYASDEWSKVKESDGIKLYERHVPGTSLMEFIAVTTIDARIEVIGEVLRDISSFPAWLADCSSAQILKELGRNDFYIYMILSPSVVSRREIVLKDKTVYDFSYGKSKISFSSTDEINIPLKNSMVRVTDMAGVFQMEYLGRNKTKFSYWLKVDPSGDIPRRMAYAIMKYYPYDSLKSLKKIVNNRKYVNLARGSEEEKQIELNVKNEAGLRRLISQRLMKFVKNRESMQAIITAERDSIKDIIEKQGSYDSVEKAVININFKYLDTQITDKNLLENLRNDKKFIVKLIDMITSDCGVTDFTVDGIAVMFIEKYK